MQEPHVTAGSINAVAAWEEWRVIAAQGVVMVRNPDGRKAFAAKTIGERAEWAPTSRSAAGRRCRIGKPPASARDFRGNSIFSVNFQ